MEKAPMSALVKGLIIALISIVVSLALQFTISDLEKMQKISWISYLIIIGGMIWACYSYSKDKNHQVTFGNLFAHGFQTTVIYTLLAVAFTYLSVSVIFPEMKDKALEMARNQMTKQGKLDDAQIDQALEMTSKYFNVFAVGGALIGSLILGVIGSLIGAAIAKKNPNTNMPA